MTSAHLKPEDLRERPQLVEDVFFSAMLELEGHAGSRPPKKHSIAQFPGSHHIEYKSGIWRVTDTYEISLLANGSQIGTTRMYLKTGATAEALVWAMQRFGRYDNAQADIVNYALNFQYEKRKFTGGRGPSTFGINGFKYTNEVHGDGITNFFGIESMASEGVVPGFLRYQGGLLV